MNARDIIARGKNAERVLEIPELSQTLEAIRMDLFDQFRRTNIVEVEAREDLHRISYALDLFEKKIASYVSQMKFELDKADRLNDA
ncbi:hypothetical protein [Agrobacterium rosae]|uniref:Uncharacterized protein n=1 Tax=Agrobacterium rosae TaxID=1972867 RepID=A0A1R3U394_9HYPH|nr:hypothetical protein [Agrobacterium rosae]SCX36030.1 hypothetical protein DSM25559_5288 [Agrobacterium rosae]